MMQSFNAICFGKNHAHLQKFSICAYYMVNAYSYLDNGEPHSWAIAHNLQLLEAAIVFLFCAQTFPALWGLGPGLRSLLCCWNTDQ